MSFATLALVVVVGLLGPLLVLPRGLRLPVILGELAAGIVIGSTGLRLVDPADATFTFLADIGFALVMFVAGSHVPIRDPRILHSLRTGALRAVAVGVIAAALGAGIAVWFGTGHAALYAVLIASSSAALALPMVDALGLTGPRVLDALPQIAIADAACIVALPLAIEPGRAGPAAVGALAVIGCAVVVFLVLRATERSGRRERIEAWSKRHRVALELRINLAVLFALAALATLTHVSIMLAGFTFGMAVAAVGEPRRLARQLFAVSDGFFGPLFFVWLGASLNLRQLAENPQFVLLGLVLGLAAIAAHAAMRATGQPIGLGILAAAQLGVPVGAATLGTQLDLLAPGEAPALLLGALVTIGVAAVAAGRQARVQPVHSG